MVEIELKFQLSEKKKKAVLKQLNQNNAQKIHLQAKYYDTPDRLLAQHHMAVRLRQEDQVWVQTFKATGKNHLERIEQEIILGECKKEPELDLTLFSPFPLVMENLERALGSNIHQLEFQFKTDVHRTFCIIESNDTTIEVCLDDGEVSTPDTSAQICEMEFELKQGSVETLILFTQDWVKKYQLWFDVRSKAERGNLLSTQTQASAAVKAKPLHLSKHDSLENAIRLMIGNALEQLLPNIAVIADQTAQPEHIHQARIAIRRMRSIFKIFGKWSAHIDDHWEEQLTQIFRQLGLTRDDDVLREEILPKLQLANAPFTEIPLTPLDQAVDRIFQLPENTCLILQLLAFSYPIQNDEENKKTSLEKHSQKILDHMHKQLVKDAQKFEQMTDDERHRTRKRCKRLRYSIENVSSLFKKKAVKQFLAHLETVQDKLGLYNDLYVAEQKFANLAKTQPEYWFAVGWITANQEHTLKEAEAELKKFVQVKTFW